MHLFDSKEQAGSSFPHRSHAGPRGFEFLFLLQKQKSRGRGSKRARILLLTKREEFCYQ